ncbi:MAG: hypothetical protein Pg6B_05420 [Candidatus Azobacteroides pseudotrichonymphae]|jgi:hypothetical protein|uniref:Plasmid pRiA4b Orf3-like domain-containing protein n=1 Tax=Azobacteroides pseudotrichonymphae genomovar. CFP2 TaxID=511995 RepID=B6YRC2_AZOPC|nr:hypothetical protein [Candidatus Azobacteroides pseudotrichonymphae]MDR0530254.1 hypothetical protein [Bacteroidales bacterium OttesenSCG-928-I14]BAG83744.1 conserved hypothetical protein [Candidatus Azobacteroides pseudotrichonymphae genomovar. CFP2]GMO35040.1 MAG: hypothetical protein Pg6B_05420 [Candidatus Azobacteroides pseudotrichonymphae]
MVYRFVLVSDEVNNFRRDITIDSEATFFQLHETILSSVNYTKDQFTSFFICNNDWSREMEITLIDMESNSDRNIYVMGSCQLSEYLNEKEQKLVYVFDQLNDRCFFIELCEIIHGENQDNPRIVKLAGNPPKQMAQIGKGSLSDFFFADRDEGEHLYHDEFVTESSDDEDLENLSEGDTFDY